MLIGKKVKLRSQEKKDLEVINQIYNDPKVNEFDLNFLIGFSKEYMEKDFDKEIKEKLEDKGFDRLSILNMDDQVVGGIGYWRSSNLRNIYMIGLTIGSDHWSSGYGQDAITTLLKYLFLERDAVKVELIVRDTNPRGKRCYEKCGFVREALLRDSDFGGGKPISFNYMGILREEFLARGDI